MAQEVYVLGTTRTPWGAGSANIKAGTVAKVDLADGPTRRSLQNERARFVVLPDIYYTAQVEGAVATLGTASHMVFRAPRAMFITGCVAQVGQTPSAGTIIVDLKYVANTGGTVAPTAAGTSMYGTATALRPQIVTGSFASALASGTSGTGVPVSGSVNAGDYVRVEVTQATGGTAMTVQLFGY